MEFWQNQIFWGSRSESWLSKNIAFKVIPAKAGIHNLLFFLDARFRGHD